MFLCVFLLICIYCVVDVIHMCVCFLWKSLHIDAGEDDVVQDVDSVDLVELSDSVSELKQRDVVHRHPEPLLGAQDLHLKRAPKSKGERSLQVPLLLAPALTQFVVTDHHLFAALAEAGVDVKGDVVASQKVYCEHFSIRFDVAQDGHHHLVIDASGQVQVVRDTEGSRCGWKPVWRHDGWMLSRPS